MPRGARNKVENCPRSGVGPVGGALRRHLHAVILAASPSESLKRLIGCQTLAAYLDSESVDIRL